MRALKFLGVAFICLVVQSCIEGEEDVWIEADGSARVVATYRVPSIALSQSEAREFEETLAEEVGANKSLRLVKNRVDTERGTRVIRIEIQTDDVTELEHMTVDHPPGEELSKADKILHAILGTVKLKLSGLDAHFEREVVLQPLLDEYLGKNAAVIMSDSEFRYTMHLPKAVKTSNAHETSKDGRTLKWRYGLSQLKGDSIVMQMTAPIPLPWWVYAVLVLLLLILVFTLYFVIKRFRMTRQLAGNKKTLPRINGEGHVK